MHKVACGRRRSQRLSAVVAVVHRQRDGHRLVDRRRPSVVLRRVLVSVYNVRRFRRRPLQSAAVVRQVQMRVERRLRLGIFAERLVGQFLRLRSAPLLQRADVAPAEADDERHDRRDQHGHEQRLRIGRAGELRDAVG